MAQVVLSSIGQAIGGPVGSAIGSFVGRGIDQAMISGLEAPRQRGPRLEGLKLQGTAEGAPISCVFGRARVAGHVIWAARFREDRRTSSRGKGGPRSVEYGYSISFAVALCEGEIDGVGRVWADGQLMDVSSVIMRVHRGSEVQAPDPLIEAIEGVAPAYRGTAYVVFEDLPLAAFGNRTPQLSFEVFRRPAGETPRLEDRLEGVCLIPGAGEFVLATQPVLRREGLTKTTSENVHGGGRADLVASLDFLQSRAPNLKRVSLVIGWFGNDLRASHCLIRPGVERIDKPTEPLIWSVAGAGRAEAHLVSEVDGAPAYGGTPSDDSVRQAVMELKARGLEVTLYPFVFMDVPAANDLPDPYGGERQAAYPWRGRVKGRAGAGATGDVGALFGTADGWGLKRLALHYAALVAETGADGLLIGSEMRGLTCTRDETGGFPAVAAFRELAAECRAIVGADVKLSYAADWSEYAGLREADEIVFHLDPLWADPQIDYVGIDWYPPLGDWRAGAGGLDAAGYEGPNDPAYLAMQMAGGDGFDWFYASEADRADQRRSPIVDGLAGEDWIYRVKDLAGWWGHAHHDRADGMRSEAPTGWLPGMKPIRLTEFGCAAVDRGGNAPNLFQDPKSAESALPPHSTGERDDQMQRRALEAVLTHFNEYNPASPIYGAPMLEAADAWCWDARPWPAFPARKDVWGDVSAWRCGHWLNGRLDGETQDIVAAILRRGGVETFDIAPISGAVQGYVIDRPMPTRDALAPLLGTLDLRLSEAGCQVSLRGDAGVSINLSKAELALPEDGPSVRIDRSLEPRPATARVRFIDGNRDYQTGSALVRVAAEGGGLDLDLPAVCGRALAEAAASRALAEGNGRRVQVKLGPLDALRLEPGDVATVGGLDGEWRAIGLDLAETSTATLEPVQAISLGEDLGEPSAPPTGESVGAPFFRMVELPPLPGSEADPRPVAVVAADPWRPMQVRAGTLSEALTVRADVNDSATVGTLLGPLGPGPRYRWDRTTSLMVRVEGRAPESRPETSVLGGANLIAVETTSGWELIQFERADLIGGADWRLSGLLRAQHGTEQSMLAGALTGAVVVFLDGPIPRTSSPTAERGLPLIWRAGPVGLPGGASVREISWVSTGVHDRPWSPAHLRVRRREDGALVMSWAPRLRLDGDRWDRPERTDEAGRFRVKVIEAEVVVRTLEVEGAETVYPAEMIAADFPGGLPAGLHLAVALWGEGYGWGEEAVVVL